MKLSSIYTGWSNFCQVACCIILAGLVMSKHCCIPKCPSIEATSSLSKIPAKRFCSGAKYKWAEDLEKIILSIRKDEWITSLFKRDQVKICHAHFRDEDLVKKGKVTMLKVGAIPIFNLPEKTTSKCPTTSRPPPKQRYFENPIYHQNLNDLKASALKYLPDGWGFKDHDHIVVFYQKAMFIGDTYPIIISINTSFTIWVSYYGWGTTSSRFLKNLDVHSMTLSAILNSISSACLCVGLPDSFTGASESIVIHQKSIHHHPNEESPVCGPPTLKLIALRSKECEVFIASGTMCENCILKEKQLRKTTLKRDSYYQKYGDLPLKHARKGSLDSRQQITIKSQCQKLKELEKTVAELLNEQSKYVSVDEQMDHDLQNIMDEGMKSEEVSPFYKLFWKEQARLNSVSKQGRRYHPELISERKHSVQHFQGHNDWFRRLGPITEFIQPNTRKPCITSLRPESNRKIF